MIRWTAAAVTLALGGCTAWYGERNETDPEPEPPIPAPDPPAPALGVFRASFWIFDSNGDGQEDEADRRFYFGYPEDSPILGDWNGDGRLEVGTVRPTDTSLAWSLDWDGDVAWDRDVDKYFFFGWPADIPVTGDWNGDGATDVGVFRAADGRGAFALDLNGTRGWEEGIDGYFVFGEADDIPVTGDWNGDGRTDIGTFRSRARAWSLDLDGDRAWNENTDVAVLFGDPGDLPVTGNWTGTGRTDIAVFRGGTWSLDRDGNRRWDRELDLVTQFGTNGDQPFLASSAPGSAARSGGVR